MNVTVSLVVLEAKAVLGGNKSRRTDFRVKHGGEVHAAPGVDVHPSRRGHKSEGRRLL